MEERDWVISKLSARSVDETAGGAATRILTIGAALRIAGR